MMHRVYETFLESLADAVDERDLLSAMAAVAQAFELRCFAYLSLRSGRRAKPKLISNYPSEWTVHYLRCRYACIDPIIAQARCDSCPFRWGPDFGRGDASELRQQLFDEAARFGICSGFTIPIRDFRGGMAAVTFATDQPNSTFFRATERYEQALQLVATCFHVHVRRKLSDDRTVEGVKLTPREYECLHWSVRGKSAWEIGQILGISRRTASFHLDNVRKKLGVRTLNQAIARFASSRSSSP